jgi:hypothetical protein
MIDKIDFYSEVEVLPTTKNKQYSGKKGVVMGVSEEDDILYGYAVLLHDKDTIDFFDKEDLVPTGKKFKREDFY